MFLESTYVSFILLQPRPDPFTEKLANSGYGESEIIGQMKKIFDKTAKLRFRDVDGPQYINFGTVRDKQPEYDIPSNQLELAG